MSQTLNSFAVSRNSNVPFSPLCFLFDLDLSVELCFFPVEHFCPPHLYLLVHPEHFNEPGETLTLPFQQFGCQFITNLFFFPPRHAHFFFLSSSSIASAPFFRFPFLLLQRFSSSFYDGGRTFFPTARHFFLSSPSFSNTRFHRLFHLIVE